MKNLMSEAIKIMADTGTINFCVDGKHFEISIENGGNFYCVYQKNSIDEDNENAHVYTLDESVIIETLSKLFKHTILRKTDDVTITSERSISTDMIDESARKIGAKKLYSFFISVLNKKIRKKIIVADMAEREGDLLKYGTVDSMILDNANLDLEFEEENLDKLVQNINKFTTEFDRLYQRGCFLTNELKNYDPSKPIDDYIDIVDEWERFFYPIKAKDIKYILPSMLDSSEKQTEDTTSSKRTMNDIDLLYRAGIGYEFMDERMYLINPAIGREKEIRKLGSVLLTPSYSAILIGNPGVGKTAIIEGLSYAIENIETKNRLEKMRILKTTPAQIVSGSKYVGEFEHKMQSLINFLNNNPDVVLYIDEFHTALGAGMGEHSNNDILNILKPYIENGTIKLIAATTSEDYNNVLKGDPAFLRRMIPIVVNEPDSKLLRCIIEGNIDKYEQSTDIDFIKDNRDEVIDILINLTAKEHRAYQEYRYNPALVLSIIETAFGYSAYDGCDTVDIKHICEAINESEGLYEVARREHCDMLLNLETNKIYSKNNNIRTISSN